MKVLPSTRGAVTLACYAERKGMSLSEVERWLTPNLTYEIEYIITNYLITLFIAHSNHGIKAFISSTSTVGPHQIRNPAGALR